MKVRNVWYSHYSENILHDEENEVVWAFTLEFTIVTSIDKDLSMEIKTCAACLQAYMPWRSVGLCLGCQGALIVPWEVFMAICTEFCFFPWNKFLQFQTWNCYCLYENCWACACRCEVSFFQTNKFHYAQIDVMICLTHCSNRKDNEQHLVLMCGDDGALDVCLWFI